MFIDAIGSPRGTTLGDIAILGLMDKSCTYSFVLQHPYNHIAIPIKNPALYLVAVYKIDSESNQTYLNLDQISQQFANTPILFPKKFDVDYATIFLDYTTMGIMLFHEASGARTSLLNPAYVEIKQMRGNNPNLQYQYLTLFRMGKVKEYLQFFPMYKNMFYAFHQQSADFIRKIHNAYVAYYIKRERNETKIDPSIFRHIHKIHHDIYIPSLNRERVIINCKRVSDYFNAMEPKEQLYHINYVNRKYAKDMRECYKKENE